MSRLYLLQSGFVTGSAVELNRVEAADLGFKEKLYVPNYRVTDTDNYYDEGIEKLFQLFRKQPDAAIKEFDFRESILLVAQRVWGDGFLTWVSQQLKQRSVGYLHRRFLEETVRYAFYGEARKMQGFQYYRLLNAAQPTEIASVNEIRVDQGLKELIDQSCSKTLPTLLSNWTATPRGTVDLIETLHIVYGRRHGHVSVALPMK